MILTWLQSCKDCRRFLSTCRLKRHRLVYW